MHEIALEELEEINFLKVGSEVGSEVKYQELQHSSQ